MTDRRSGYGVRGTMGDTWPTDAPTTGSTDSTDTTSPATSAPPATSAHPDSSPEKGKLESDTCGDTPALRSSRRSQPTPELPESGRLSDLPEHKGSKRCRSGQHTRCPIPHVCACSCHAHHEPALPERPWDNGPWRYWTTDNAGGPVWRVYLDYETPYKNLSDGYMVASVEGDGNARLIALAPEMAEAILRICDEANRRGVDGPGMASDEAVAGLHEMAERLKEIQ